MRIVGFTGHRPEKLPWRENEQDERCIALKEKIRSMLREFAEQKYTGFACGGARGADFYFAETVLELKEQHPGIQLLLFLGYRGQGDDWKPEDQSRLERLKENADIVRFIGADYTKDCMLKRDRQIVAWSDLMLAVYDRKVRGGTSYTMNCIREMKKSVYCIDPGTLEVEQFIGALW